MKKSVFLSFVFLMFLNSFAIAGVDITTMTTEEINTHTRELKELRINRYRKKIAVNENGATDSWIYCDICADRNQNNKIKTLGFADNDRVEIWHGDKLIDSSY